eukprot:1194647-Prorocentrum_minimum.AAC.2
MAYYPKTCAPPSSCCSSAHSSLTLVIVNASHRFDVGPLQYSLCSLDATTVNTQGVRTVFVLGMPFNRSYITIDGITSGLMTFVLFWTCVPRENIPALPASDWSLVRIYPRFLRLIGIRENICVSACSPLFCC